MLLLNAVVECWEEEEEIEEITERRPRANELHLWGVAPTSSSVYFTPLSYFIFAFFDSRGKRRPE